VSHLHSNSGSRLADKTKQIPSHFHFVYRVDRSASSARFFSGQELTSHLYVPCHEHVFAMYKHIAEVTSKSNISLVASLL
jgi:hypothetical protein